MVAAAEEEAAWRPGDPLPVDDSAVTHVVGGNRAAELRVSGGLANSGDVLWMTLWLTPNGDDPYPALAMHLFEDRARADRAARCPRHRPRRGLRIVPGREEGRWRSW